MCDWVPARYNGEFLEIERERIDYIDVTPRQVVGASASLIPYVAHDEANRALMGTHMQCQAVPLVKPEAPIIGTGMESEISEVMGRVVKAPFEGKVMQVDASKVVLEGQKGQKETFHIESFKRTSNATTYTQRAVVVPGQRVKQGDILIDGPASENGELALGRNLLIAFASLYGLGYEDAIVISENTDASCFSI